MRPLSLLVVASTLAVGAWALSARAPQDGPGVDAAAMAEMMKLAGPGPEHDELARYVGDWDVEITMTMPGMPEMAATAKATATSILGERFLEIDTVGEMMGMPTESKLILGFDRRHERWTSVGLDTMGTYWVSGQGVREDDGLLRLHGVDEDTMGKQVFFNEIDFASVDEFTFSVLFTELGGATFDPPLRMVEVRYTRSQ